MNPIFSLGVAATLLGVYGRYEASRLQVRRYEVFLPDWPSQLDGMRVAQLSDIHAGIYTSRRFLRELVVATNALRPDLVALTGDFVSRPSSYCFYPLTRPWMGAPEQHAYALAEELCHLRAPLGCLAVRGNHDGLGASFARVQEALQGAGVRFLMNQASEVSGCLPVVGLDDLRVGTPDYDGALGGINASSAHLILAHNPRTAWLMRDRNALILSGHTHAGQVCFWGVGGMKKPVDTGRSEWLCGSYELGRALLYVSGGVGTIAIPMRLLAPPEVALFTLRGASRPALLRTDANN